MYDINYLKNIIKESNYNYNEFYLDRYFNFCNSLIRKYNYKKIDKQESEKHHILPVSLFPEFSKEKSNIINISLREHYLAHWILAKIFGGKMWFAFNQMKRIIKNPKKNSILYEYSKKYLKKIISSNNKGLKRNNNFKESLRKRMKNKMLAKDNYGNIFLVDRNDERLKKGILVHFKKGSCLSDKTKRKISENGLKGRKSYVNIKTGEVKFFKENDTIPENFIISPNPVIKNNKYCKDTVWIFDKEKNKQLRIKRKDLINFKNKRYIFKRINTQGFSKINNSNKKKYLDLKSKKYIFIEENNKKNYHVRYEGVKINNIIVYIINNKIIVGKKNLLRFINNNEKILNFLNRKKISQNFLKNNEDHIINIINGRKILFSEFSFDQNFLVY